MTRPPDSPARWPARAAWSSAAIGSAIGVVTLWLTWTTRAVGLPVGFEGGLAPALLLPLLLFVGAGGLLAAKRPGNPVGWVLLAIGLAWQVVGLAGVVRIATFAAGSTSVWAAWAWDVLWVPGIALVPVLFLLFPDGAPPSRRWRPALWVLAAAGALLLVSLGLRPVTLWNTPVVDNPIGIASLDGLLVWLETIANGLLAVGVLVSLAAPIVRHRRAGEVQRYQVKWFLTAAAMVVAAWIVADLLQSFGAEGATLVTVRMVPLATLPLAITVAVLRYRLYDIDRIVSRTVTYAAITLVLGGIYAGGVLGVGSVVAGLTGGGGELVVAGSTLAVAAAFRPVRSRVQAVVDRRFDRASYDAQLTLGDFSQRLRDEVDLSMVVGDLESTARETVGPRFVSVWLPAPEQAP